MAVLRASRIWVAEIPPTLEAHRPIELGPLGPETQGGATVVTIPDGKKAIVRTMQANPTSIPGTGNDYNWAVWMQPAGAGYWFLLHWSWWSDDTLDLTKWQPSSTWTGTLVLNAGERVQVTHTAPIPVHTHASGMLVDAGVNARSFD